jgi:hypothetical protein
MTATHTPADLFAAPTLVVRQTAQARTTGTATPLPTLWVVTPTAENEATATHMAARETAIVRTTGTPPANRIIVGPTPGR